MTRFDERLYHNLVERREQRDRELENVRVGISNMHIGTTNEGTTLDPSEATGSRPATVPAAARSGADRGGVCVRSQVHGAVVHVPPVFVANLPKNG